MIDLSLKELIIIHINYRDVFNAPVKKGDLIRWVAGKSDIATTQQIEQILNDLKNEGLIIEKDGFVAVSGNEKAIELQPKKSIHTKELIAEGSSLLKFLGKLPFIKFIGVSGSVAADNPTPNKNNHVDLDLFVISSEHSLWLIFSIERILTNIVRLVKGDHFYCFNYVTEETFLEIYNKSFYTASEMVNIVPVVDKGIFEKFVNSNEWFKTYYSKESIPIEGKTSKKSYFPFMLLIPLNYLFFFFFSMLRALKKIDVKYALSFNLGFDPKERCNFKRISNANGGYQERIKMRFSDLLASNFPGHVSTQVVDKLFPAEGEFDYSEEHNVDDLDISELFEKYA